MPRVTLEDRLFGERRLHRLADIMDYSVRSTMGTLAYLWHESQLAMRGGGTAEEIGEWSWIDNSDEAEQWVKALMIVGFIHLEASGQYAIHGNEKHIENISSYAARGALGGKQSGEVRRAKSIDKTKLIEATASVLEANALASEPITVHNITLHNNISPPNSPETDSGRSASVFDLNLADRWHREHSIGFVPNLKPTLAWAKAFRLLRDRDGFTEGDLLAIFEFVKRDAFWGKNAVSPLGLRVVSKTTGLKKIQNIQLAMRQQPPKLVAAPIVASKKEDFR